MLANGSTQIESLRTAGCVAAAPGDDAPPAISSATLAATFFQSCAFGSPVQPVRFAHWMRSNGMGSFAPSSVS